LYDRTGGDGSDPGAGSEHQGGPLSKEEAEAMFKQMFGDKPVHQIVRELEEAMKQEQAGMEAQERELRERAANLRMEASDLQIGACSALELTPSNWDSETAGKTVFIKFLAPW